MPREVFGWSEILRQPAELRPDFFVDDETPVQIEFSVESHRPGGLQHEVVGFQGHVLKIESLIANVELHRGVPEGQHLKFLDLQDLANLTDEVDWLDSPAL